MVFVLGYVLSERSIGFFPFHVAIHSLLKYGKVQRVGNI